MKVRLQEQYKNIPDQVVTIALDSVDYDEERAAHILKIMVQEDEKPKTAESKISIAKSTPSKVSEVSIVKPVSEEKEDRSPSPVVISSDSGIETPEKSEKSANKRSKAKKEVPK